MTITDQASTDTQQERRPSLVERARALAPAVAERAEQVDRQRYVDEETIQALVDSGLTRALQPATYGGEQADPADFIEAVIELSKADTSAGWVLMLLGTHSWELSHMTDQVQDDLFAKDPTTLVSSSYAAHGQARPVEGGYLLNGRWKSSSGVVHASWAIVGAAIEVNGEKLMHNFVVDLSEATVVDDWFTLGVRGSGSRSIVLENVFVPAHRAIDRDILLAKLGPGLRRNTAPLYQVPQGYLYGLVAGAPALGAAWAFYEEFKRQAKLYVRRFDGAVLSEERVQLIRLADARVTLEDQQRAVLFLLRDAYERAGRGEGHTPLELGRGIYDVARVARATLSVAQDLFPSLTAGAVYEANPLQRQYRDLIVARQHFTENTDFAAVTAANLELDNPVTAAFLLTPEKLAAARERAQALYGA